VTTTARTHNLTKFGLSDMAACGSKLRELGKQEKTMEAFAKRAALHFYESLVDNEGKSASALVRVFATITTGDLTLELKALLPSGVSPSVRCLTLLGTAGLKPEWRARTMSSSYQVIPLVSRDMVERLPMFSQMIRQFGIKLANAVNPSGNVLIDDQQQTYNVFFVPEAEGSPFVPAQANFVVPFGIRSVLGFGGMLPSGNLFAVIIFSKVAVPRNAANLFATIALSLRLALLRFDRRFIFEEQER
jgi:hypothetical protein